VGSAPADPRSGKRHRRHREVVGSRGLREGVGMRLYWPEGAAPRRRALEGPAGAAACAVLPDARPL
jgi:hypothetical protein